MDTLKNVFLGTPIPSKASEGIAKLELFYNDDKPSEEVIGCIVRNNDRLTVLSNPKHLYVQKYKKTKFFAYFKAKQASLASLKRISITVEVNSTDSTPSTGNRKIICNVDNLAAEEKIVRGGECHAFVPCESIEFNNSTFLRRYSKNVHAQGLESCSLADKEIYSLSKIKEQQLHIIHLPLKTGSSFSLIDDVYDQVVDGPLFLADKTSVVGYCTKNEESKKMVVQFFGGKESTVWAASHNPEKSNQETPPLNVPACDKNYNSNHHNDAGSKHDNCADGDHDNDEPTASNAVSDGRRNSPVERSLSMDQTGRSVALSAEEKGSTGTGSIPQNLSQVTVSGLCEIDSTFVKDLGLLLDKKSTVKSDIMSLADKVNAHPVIKSKCNSNYNHSPAALLLDRYEVGKLSVQKLTDELRKIQREDLATDIIKSISETEIQKTIEEVLLAGHNQKLLERFTSKLDEKCNFNWRRLGIQLNVDNDVLNEMERASNPAEAFLIEYAYTALTSKELSVRQLYLNMKKLGREEEMKVLFEKHQIDADEKSMKDVFMPYSMKMEALCQLLNKNHCSKGWLHLAQLWGLEQEKYLYFIPDTTESPTRILLEWLMMAHPEFTVSKLCDICYELKRTDAAELLEKNLKDAYSVIDR